MSPMSGVCVIPLCFVRDRHATPEVHDRDCTGCLPARAEYGLLCSRHRGRLARALIQAPDLVGHIRTELEPSAAVPDGQPVGHRAPPAPVRLDAVDDADLTFAAVAQLAEHVADVLDLKGPKNPGAWRDQHGRLIGVTADHAVEAATLAAQWLHVRLDWLSAWEDIPGVFEEADTVILTSGMSYDTPAGAVRVIERVGARWPTASRERYIPGVVCRACDARGSLVYHPPAAFGAGVLIQCARCSAIVPDGEVGWYARLVEDIGPHQAAVPGARVDGARTTTLRLQQPRPDLGPQEAQSA